MTAEEPTKTYRFGIDAGSKTVKVVIVDEDGTVVNSIYRRHLSNIRETLVDILHNLVWRYGDLPGKATVTGSAGIALAEMLKLPFVQEVLATEHAVRELYPDADAVIELGGEDAKVMYLSGNPEQRMNATCAGGTGGFIDTIAFMLGVRSSDMSRLAGGASRIYPIASRCAVFAQTDVRPLLNAGAKKSDIAASVLEAVVRQTITGLACGRPIEGKVIFLGGPLQFIPDLVRRFQIGLGLKRGEGIRPRWAHIFTAHGAALYAGELSESKPTSLGQLEERMRQADAPEDDLTRLEPLFATDKEREAFKERHARVDFPRKRLFDCKGPLYLGIDAGSTTVKMAVIDDAGNLVYSCYTPVQGDALATATDELLDFERSLPHVYGTDKTTAWVAHATATGYGEDLLCAALGIDSGIVETTAHARAAMELVPDATFVLDIGGQDMKALWIKNSMVANAILNEACSSGCGSFIEGTAHSLHLSPHAFNDAALTSKHPVDLGTKCTVFMSSRVKHAQKIGASVDDLAAGIAYSVVKNALFRIIGAERIDSLGPKIVVQGGAFKSDAVLRAFEKICSVEVIRPESAHLMGAIGAALIARERAHDAMGKADDSLDAAPRSTMISAHELESLSVERFSSRCPGCSNACLLAIADFGNARRFISGNKCSNANNFEFSRNGDPKARAEGTNAVEGHEQHSRPRQAPNAIAVEQHLLQSVGSIAQGGARGTRSIGIMNCFETYEYTPFWRTLFAELGFSVIMPDDARGASFEQAALATVPAEGACFPAKIAHMRAFDLMNAGADTIFMPRFNRIGRCAVSCEYADALADAVPAFEQGEVRLSRPHLSSFKVARIAKDEDDLSTLFSEVGSFCPDGAPLSREEFDRALEKALASQREFFDAIARANGKVIDWLAEDAQRHAIVVAGRPYHTDPRLMRGIDTMLTKLGFAILCPTSSDTWATRRPHDPNCPPWKPGKHLARLARFAAENPQVDLVCLQSFGCGYDALSLEDARDILEAAGKPFTALKIDDLSDKAHLNIRLRTLAEGIESMSRRGGSGQGLLTTSPRKRERTIGHPAASILAATSHVEKGHTAVEGFAGNVEAPEASGHKLEHIPNVMSEGISTVDAQVAQRQVPGDVCFTAAALIARTLRVVEENSQVKALRIPLVCNRCLLDGLAHTVWRLNGSCPEIIEEERWPQPIEKPATPKEKDARRVLVGIVGNPLLCFDAFMNDSVLKLLERLGCDVAMPGPDKLFCEDVRYLDQLDEFSRKGVDCVIYLQSFGCMKAHVHARGFAHEYARRYPDMPITVIDYDPESSALNRENRIRLAVEAAMRAKSER